MFSLQIRDIMTSRFLRQGREGRVGDTESNQRRRHRSSRGYLLRGCRRERCGEVIGFNRRSAKSRTKSTERGVRIKIESHHTMHTCRCQKVHYSERSRRVCYSALCCLASGSILIDAWIQVSATTKEAQVPSSVSPGK